MKSKLKLEQEQAKMITRSSREQRKYRSTMNRLRGHLRWARQENDQALVQELEAKITQLRTDKVRRFLERIK